MPGEYILYKLKSGSAPLLLAQHRLKQQLTLYQGEIVAFFRIHRKYNLSWVQGFTGGREGSLKEFLQVTQSVSTSRVCRSQTSIISSASYSAVAKAGSSALVFPLPSFSLPRFPNLPRHFGRFLKHFREISVRLLRFQIGVPLVKIFGTSS